MPCILAYNVKYLHGKTKQNKIFLQNCNQISCKLIYQKEIANWVKYCQYKFQFPIVIFIQFGIGDLFSDSALPNSYIPNGIYNFQLDL